MNQPPKELHHAAPIEIDHDLVVFHALAALHRAKISQKAIVAVAHPSQSTVLEQSPGAHPFHPAAERRENPDHQSCGCVLGVTEAETLSVAVSCEAGRRLSENAEASS